MSTRSTRILLAYYTRTGNTKKFAMQIKEYLGGDLFSIETVEAYPPSYQEVLKVSKAEIQNKYKPPLKKLVENIDQYDIIFIGTPNWYSTMAPPVLTFLSSHELSKKIVIPFATHGGGGEARCLTDIAKNSSGAQVLEGMAIYGSPSESMKPKILQWLKNLKIFNNILMNV